MDIRPFRQTLASTIAGFRGKTLGTAAAGLLTTRLSQLLDDAVTQAMTERIYLVSAKQLREMRAEVPTDVDDAAMLACRGSKLADGRMSLVIEHSEFTAPEILTMDRDDPKAKASG